MSEEVRARLFDAFFTTKPAGRGTGLGLFAVDRILRATDGTCEVTSSPGRGTSFILSWPTAPAFVPPPPDGVSAAPTVGFPENRGRVLLVEDEPLVRAFMAEILSGAGDAVTEAANGFEALLAVRQIGACDALCIDGVIRGPSSSEIISAFTARFPRRPILLREPEASSSPVAYAWAVSTGPAAIVTGVAAAFLIAASCGHPRPPAREPELDDEQRGATPLTPDENTHQVAHAGTLDPAGGDTVDWLTVIFPEGGSVRFTAVIRVEGERLPTELAVFDERGAILSNFENRRRGKTASSAEVAGSAPTGRIYLRVADASGGALIAYELTVTDRGKVPPPAPPGPPPCDPHKWDAKNPNCEHECNFADPDLGREVCCKVMEPCVRKPRGRSWDECVGHDVRFDGNTIIANVGSNHALLQYLDAHLRLDGPEPEPSALSEMERIYRWNRLSRNKDSAPRLALVELRAKESVWRLSFPKDHDLAWLAAHAKAVVVEPPTACRLLGSGRP